MLNRSAPPYLLLVIHQLGTPGTLSEERVHLRRDHQGATVTDFLSGSSSSSTEGGFESGLALVVVRSIGAGGMVRGRDSEGDAKRSEARRAGLAWLVGGGDTEQRPTGERKEQIRPWIWSTQREKSRQADQLEKGGDELALSSSGSRFSFVDNTSPATATATAEQKNEERQQGAGHTPEEPRSRRTSTRSNKRPKHVHPRRRLCYSLLEPGHHQDYQKDGLGS